MPPRQRKDVRPAERLLQQGVSARYRSGIGLHPGTAQQKLCFRREKGKGHTPEVRKEKKIGGGSASSLYTQLLKVSVRDEKKQVVCQDIPFVKSTAQAKGDTLSRF